MKSLSSVVNFAICINETLNYSACCLHDSLLSLGFQVDIVSLMATSSTNAEYSVHALNHDTDLSSYHVVIYQYGSHFAKLSAWFNAYQGSLIISYQASVPLSYFRSFRHTGSEVRKLEQDRQEFSEWVQANSQRCFWLADCLAAAQDLARWGVNSSVVCPPFTALELGFYADKRLASADSACVTVLIVGDFAPYAGHESLLRLVAAYRQLISKEANVICSRLCSADFTVYQEDILSLVHQLDLDSCIKWQDEALTSNDYLLADVLLILDRPESFSIDLIRAQAMGLPVVQVSHLDDEGRLAFAHTLHQAVFDSSVRAQLIVDGYRNIDENFSHDQVEQTFLSSVFTVLQG